MAGIIEKAWVQGRTVLGSYIPGVMLSVVLAMAANFVSIGYGGPTILFALLFGMAFNLSLIHI